MEKLRTIQKRNNLNEVFKVGRPGPGGAHHDYVINLSPCADSTGSQDTIFRVEFQRGPRSEEPSRPGVLDVDLLEIVRDRLHAFQQGDFATRENATALALVETALLWMNKRVEDRAERGVLGTTTK